MATFIQRPIAMSIAPRLVSLRKRKGLTQRTLADALGLHITQVKRYKAGTFQPSLEALKKIRKG